MDTNPQPSTPNRPVFGDPDWINLRDANLSPCIICGRRLVEEITWWEEGLEEPPLPVCVECRANESR